ncbi:hypothetical protein SAMN04488564_108145 [Lentzea waywayandensis]|uniref:Uncharacterized protein n=1 Tax=Lentzea waywayandensis TaxID=84724 RepID=A0A1I6F4S2_9PSEU|nr:hypothetical protein SAMN04488564_108145 [Lentzea waywayandensis]
MPEPKQHIEEFSVRLKERTSALFSATSFGTAPQGLSRN